MTEMKQVMQVMITRKNTQRK